MKISDCHLHLRITSALHWALMGCLLLIPASGCRRAAPITLAVIPRTCGTMLWETEHTGAEFAAADVGISIYWNAPTREDDIAGQIALVERVVAGNYQGLILAPDHVLALITPVRRAMYRGIPTVIIGSALPIPPEKDLSYILNDEEEGGRIAGERVALLLHGHGSIAILGINADIDGIMRRSRSIEEFLTKSYPDIHIVLKRMGTFNVPHEQQVAEEGLKANHALDAIVSLTSASTRGILSAIKNNPGDRIIKVVAFDPDSIGFESPSLDSVIVQDTRNMGYRAVRTIHARLQGRPMPSLIQVEPMLVTRQNLSTARVRELTTSDWHPGRLHWEGGGTP